MSPPVRPLPKVGSKIRMWMGRENVNSWKHWGVVRAVVDGHVVVKRWLPHKRLHFYELIDPWMWRYLPFEIHR